MPNKKAGEVVFVLVNGGRRFREDALTRCDERISALVETVRLLVRQHTETRLLMFPAGYLGVRTFAQLEVAVEQVNEALDQIGPGFGVLWGIDVNNKRPKATQKKSSVARQTGYPYFVSYRGPKREKALLQQLTTSTKEGSDPSVLQRWVRRPALLPGTDIAVLICGEALGECMRARILEEEPRALVVPAHQSVNLRIDHVGMGHMSWHHPLAAFQKANDVAVALCDHTRSPRRHAYSWPAKVSQPCKIQGVPRGLTLRCARF